MSFAIAWLVFSRQPPALSGVEGSIVSSAAEESPVQSNYEIEYSVDDAGLTKVAMLIKLFNPSQNVYISGYSLLINVSDIENVEARDGVGSLNPKVTKSPAGTEISFSINQKIVGTEKPLILSINYLTRKIAQKNGLIWEIILPKSTQEGSFNATLNVPNNFGPQIFISPMPTVIEKKLTKNVYKFSDPSFAQTGAILSFGPYQLYGVNLKYHLKNANLWPAETRVALPPSLLNDQLFVLDQITPVPSKTEIDEDGNSLATFRLGAGQSLTVQVKGRAKIFNPARDLTGSGIFSEIPLALKNKYLRPQKYWEVDDDSIKKVIADTVPTITDDSLVASIAQKLFNTTTSLLNYNAGRIQPDLTRLGAKEALLQPNEAVCMEFADLYVTLLRRAGIPAQLLEGYALTTNDSSRPAIGDVLHSWVRLYIPKIGWLSADPTWAKTTGGLDYFTQLDTNHFTFVIKGLNSEFPYPAGAYKISPDQVGDIKVEALPESEDFGESPGILTYKFIRTGLPIANQKDQKVKLTLRNDGKTTLFSPKLNIMGKSTAMAPDLPPFSQYEYDFSNNALDSKGLDLGKVSWLSQSGKVETVNLVYKQSPVKSEPLGTLVGVVNLRTITIFLILGLCSWLGYFLIVRARPRQ